MKKIVSFCIAMALAISLSLSAFALEPIQAELTDALYIKTQPVPQSATDYAISIFSSLGVDNFEALGIKCSSPMKLSPGFSMVNSYDGNFIDDVYFFLISNENAFVASLLISYHNGEYGFQISKTDYASGMNKVAKNDSYVLSVSCNDYACYSLTRNSITTISTNKEQQVSLQAKLNAADLTTSVLKDNTVSVNIADTICVNSYFIPGDNHYYIGVINCPDNNDTCWAAVTASIVNYHINGFNGTQYTAMAIRDQIVQGKINMHGTKYGTITDIQYFLTLTLAKQYTKYQGQLPFIIMQTIMYNNSPCAIEFSEISGHISHSAVLDGFCNLSNSPHDSQYQGYYILDPMESGQGRVLIGYNSIYHTSYYCIQNGNSYYPEYIWSQTCVESSLLPY